MRIKRWLAVAAVGGLAAAATMGGLAAAHGGGEEIGPRVAEILELDEEDVIDAFDQAQTDLQDQRFTDQLDQAVEDDRITQEQADEFQSWYDERPDGLSNLRSGKFGFWRGSGDVAPIVADALEVDEESIADAIREARCDLILERFQERIDQAVEDGHITQEKADAIAGRLGNCDEKGWPMRLGKSRMFGGDHKMFMGGHNGMCDDKMADTEEETTETAST